MISVVPYLDSLADQLAALWRALNPGWTWLDDPRQRAAAWESSASVERIGFVVVRGDAVIASVFGTRARAAPQPGKRVLHILARPRDIAPEWLGEVLVAFADVDRARPGTWQVVNAPAPLVPALAPVLEAAQFVRRFVTVEIAWRGDTVASPDAGALTFQIYRGGDAAIDRAIVDLHNRSYRGSPLVPALDPAALWVVLAPHERREYVLALEGGRTIGYVEWWVTDGAAWITSLAVGRSHWGTGTGRALLAAVMRLLVDLGHRDIAALVRAGNAPALHLARELGWKEVGEASHTYARVL